MNPQSPTFRTRLLMLASAVLALGGLACGSSSTTDGVAMTLETTAVWVGADTGLLQCQESDVATLDDAIKELGDAGVAAIGAQQGTPRHLTTCTDCSCTALVYNFVAIDESDLDMAQTLGYTLFDAKEVSFY